jgi:predicted nucleic-acid-binding Zn-ribbon protein
VCIYGFKIMIPQVIIMAVYCKDCGHVNENDSIYQRDAKGDPVFMAGSQNAPKFSCIRCGSKNIVPIDE